VIDEITGIEVISPPAITMYMVTDDGVCAFAIARSRIGAEAWIRWNQRRYPGTKFFIQEL
jgi:hypothetical protein